MTVIATISTDDPTGAWTGPVPFLNAQGRGIGRTVRVRWDGRFTVAEIDIDDTEYAKLLKPRLQLALDQLWTTGTATI